MSIINFFSNHFYSTKAQKPGRAYLPSAVVTLLLSFYAFSDAFLLAATGLATANASKLVFGVGALCVLAFWIFIRGLDARLGSFATVTGVLLTLFILAVPFAYGMTALTLFPLEDARILEIDRLIGFDWDRFLSLMDHYPKLNALLGLSYQTIGPQLLCLVFFSALTRDYATINMLVFALGVSFVAVNIIAVMAPAAGVATLVPHNFVNLDIVGYLNHSRQTYLALRNGSLRLIDFANVAALVTFPSCHTVVAVLATLAARRVPYMFGPMLVLNILMLVSTVTHGGHYLTDVIAGAVIAALAWRMAEASAQWRFASSSEPVTRLSAAARAVAARRLGRQPQAAIPALPRGKAGRAPARRPRAGDRNESADAGSVGAQ